MRHRRFRLGKFMAFGVILLSAFGGVSVARAGDIAAGKAKALFVCSDCHGVNGISVAENFPNLAGQKEMYLTGQLLAFKAGRRRNNLMNLIAKQLSDADIDNLAAFFASLPCDPPRAPK